ncbi:hypothetical protein [Actinoplanes sp. NPDC049118]|uniref:hypothetical protein n=1 Tax=Actinoplanes sp. NPDC049118 TaxID=3155769 RepID=UPI0033D3EB8E
MTLPLGRNPACSAEKSGRAGAPGTATRQPPIAAPATVVGATPFGIPAVAALVARSPAGQTWAHLLAMGGDRGEIMLRGLCRILVKHALGHGHVDLLPPYGAAVWLDRTIALPEPPGLARLLAIAGEPSATAIRDRLSGHRPHGPYLHLIALATGSISDAVALLEHRHRRLDRAGVAAYAVANTDTELAALTAAGYQPGDPRWLLDGVPAWPMRRPPTGRRSSPHRCWPPEIS